MKTSKLLWLFFVVVLITVIVALGVTQAAEFSADLVLTKGEKRDNMKIYVSGNKYRLEKAKDNQHTIMIRRRGST